MFGLNENTISGKEDSFVLPEQILTVGVVIRASICSLPSLELPLDPIYLTWIDALAIALLFGPFMLHADDVQYADAKQAGRLIGNWISMRLNVSAKTLVLGFASYLFILGLKQIDASFGLDLHWLRAVDNYPLPIWMYLLSALLLFGRWAMVCQLARRVGESAGWYILRPYLSLAVWVIGLWYAHLIVGIGRLTRENWTGPLLSSIVLTEIIGLMIALGFVVLDPSDSWRKRNRRPYISASVWTDSKLNAIVASHRLLWVMTALMVLGYWILRYALNDPIYLLGWAIGCFLNLLWLLRKFRENLE